MGTLKRTNVKFNKENNIKRRISKEQIDENEDINRLIEEEIREEERKTRQQKETEDHTKNAALQLVNEFIENETRSSFKRKVKKSKSTTAGAGKVKKSTITDTPDSGITPNETKEKTKKVKKSTITDSLNSGIITAESEEKTKKVKKLTTTDSLDSGTVSGADLKTSNTAVNKSKPKKKKKAAKAKKGATDCVVIDMETEHSSSIDEGGLEEIIVKPRDPQVDDTVHETATVTTETKDAATNKKTKTTTEGKKKKKKKKTSWEKFEDEENEHEDEIAGTDEKKPPKTKNLKAKGGVGGGGKKRNKISPTPPPLGIPDDINNSNKGNKLKTKMNKDLFMESFSDDNMLDDHRQQQGQQQPKTTENSCLTIVLMALCLESELPVAFYKKLVRSHKFKDALRNLNAEERALVLAMMDDMSPSVDCLPNSNGIFIDSFKDRLTVIT